MSINVVDSIPRSGREAGSPLPLSAAQKRMWIMEQLADGAPTFTTPVAVRLRGQLDRSALIRALDGVVRRHEVLRTTVRAPHGSPLQYVDEGFRLDLPVTDLGHLPQAEREPAAMELLAREARTRLDFAERVIRARLIRLAADHHILVVAVHHIAWDGWSTGIFYDEVSKLYLANVTGVPVDLPPLRIQYADYTQWQRGLEDSPLMGEHLAYWLDELAGGVPPLDLPADFRPGPERSPRAELVEHLVTAEHVGDLREFARRSRVSMAMLATAAMHAGLHRVAGKDIVASGLPAANREHADLEQLIGFFVNSVVLKTTASPSTTFAQLLTQVRTKMLRAMRHASLPLERLVDALGAVRDTSHNPLAQISLAFDYGADAALLNLPGLHADFIELYNGTAQDDLGVFGWQRGAELRLVAEFRTDLYAPRTAARFLRQIERALAFGVADPDRPLAELDVLTSGDRAELARLSSGPRAPGPFEPLHVMVERQVTRTPDATALLYEGTSVTYGELNGRANRLARHLGHVGVKRHDCVAVALERSIDATAAILAVFKLGAHYVPLDPALPEERLEFMAEDTAPVTVVTSSAAPSRTWPGGRVVVLEDVADEIAIEDAHDLDAPVSVDDVAYILYTSGSTGRPKGVVVPHRGVANLLAANQEDFAITADDRMLHGSSLTFDTSIPEVFWPLSYGSTVVIAPPHAVADQRAFAALLAGAGVTIAFLVPTVLAAYLAADPPPIPRLRLMMLGGEAFEPALLRRLRRYAPHARVFNVYGPTEASIGTTKYEVPPGADPSMVPIGLPMAGTRCHLLDADLRPLPPGALGELYIGGIGVAHGYRNRPGLTADSFLPDPFSDEPGARMYRTGDVVRYTPEGPLEIYGRSDDQVKLHGVRIEPGEIQAVLEQDPAVAAARVVVRADDGGRKLLAAYLVAAEGADVDVRRLRGLATAGLPRLLVPSRFIVVREFPMTVSGKLDIRALPWPGTGTEAEDAGHVPPGTPAERLVAEHVADVVGLERVSLHDDFFALGGNSLDGARLVFALRDATDAEIVLGDLFRASSIIGLARLVEERCAGRGGPRRAVRLNRSGHARLHLAPAMSGAPFAYAELARHLDGRVVVDSHQVPGLDDDATPPGTIAALAQTLLAAVREEGPSSPCVLGGWSMGGLVALEAALLLRAEGKDVALVLIDPTVLPPDPIEFSDAEIAAMFGQEVTALAGPAVEVAGRRVMERRFKVYAAAARAVGRHRMGEPFPGPALLLRPPATASGTGWDGLLRGPVRKVTLPGDHYSLLQGDNARVLADHLAAYLT